MVRACRDANLEEMPETNNILDNILAEGVNDIETAAATQTVRFVVAWTTPRTRRPCSSWKEGMTNSRKEDHTSPHDLKMNKMAMEGS